MKHFYPPFYVIFLAVLLITDHSNPDQRQIDELRYTALLNNYTIENISGERPKLTGIDKASIRDFVMTVDIQKGYVPVENKISLQERMVNARLQEDRDFNWELMSSSVAGRHRAFMIDPNDGKLFSGSVTGGLWVSMDYKNDNDWVSVPGLENIPISSITCDPNNSNVYYLGTGESETAFLNYRESTSEGNGIWKSTDGGVTWSNLASTHDFAFVNDIVVRDESGQSVIYAGVASGIYREKVFSSAPNDGLYRSADGGQTWEQVLPNIPGESFPYTVSDIELASDNRIYVGTRRNLVNTGGGIALSSINGTDWVAYDGYLNDVTNFYGADGYPGRVVLSAAPSDPTVVYGLFTSGVYNQLGQLRDYPNSTILKRSADGGGTWTDIPLPGGWSNIPWHAMAVEVDPADENKILIGALNVYVLSDASSPALTELDWLQISSWWAHPAFSGGNPSQEELDSLLGVYVHADIHDIQFLGNSDEVLITTDGGLHYSENMSLTSGYDKETGITDYPSFSEINSKLNTTQYYTVALHPTSGVNFVLGGTQDNGTLQLRDGDNDRFSAVSGGDGAYCFYDWNTPINITSYYNNNYFINNAVSQIPVITNVGNFINPVDYDDFNNILYCNAVVGPTGGLIGSNVGLFLDQLYFVDVNSVLGLDNYGLGNHGLINLFAGITEPFSAIRISEDKSTVFAATHLGKVYRITNLPYNPVTTRIDNSQLPVGYISSIAVCDNAGSVMVTYSNYGVESVWYTSDAGNNWNNIDRNLPDIPVRWGEFNPYDNRKVIIATETGVWGMEDIEDPAAEWGSYNEGLPNIRVDMIRVRKGDSAIVAATHGRGIYIGKFNQGPAFEQPLGLEDNLTTQITVYPNPASDFINFKKKELTAPEISKVGIYDLGGRQILQTGVSDSRVFVGDLPAGLYVLRAEDRNENLVLESRIILKGSE